MGNLQSPAQAAFLKAVGDRAQFAQILILRVSSGFALRHVANASSDATTLDVVPIPELRALAQETATGAFRPLKSAPNLRPGWTCSARDPVELFAALEALYPGGITDWFYRDDSRKITSYQDHTQRQTGMYRITARLDEDSSIPVIAACCDSRFCLKNRRWTYTGASVEPAGDLDLPCLEPCAVLMEFARKAVRISQESTIELSLSESEIDSLLAALSDTATQELEREADFADPRNLRRQRLLKQRLNAAREKLQQSPQQ